METLLETFGLKFCSLNDFKTDISQYIQREINWDFVDSILKEMRHNAECFLLKALNDNDNYANNISNSSCI